MRKLMMIFIASLFLIACDSNRVYDQYKAIPNSSWDAENVVEFEVPITDTISRNNIYINLRNNKDYEFNNLFLITQIEFPNGTNVVDTLEYEMTTKDGHWLGKGSSDIKENVLFYKENVKFYLEGTYKILVEQAMRKSSDVEGNDPLEGVSDVGIRVEKVKN
ncbi:gliding motility lipoprotein GldH [Aureivirga marina]|uniref:gliding motility lipoprotein GldH n=1 Tax=Aureivirga marina TaxID=1182451 RepID=UPI001E39691A|nr:gliding motility lipoprotein GldH [Aureivirga marina]